MDRRVIIGIVIAVVLLVLGGGFFFLQSRNQTTKDEDGFVEEVLPKMEASEVGLEIQPTDDLKYIQFTLTKLDGLKHIEWEFTYDAVAPDTGDGGGGMVTQGFGGEADIDSSESSYTSEKRELGTCSTGGKCRFDTGIEKVNLIIKVTKTDGKVYQVDASKNL
jgi:hypothetical protein